MDNIVHIYNGEYYKKPVREDCMGKAIDGFETDMGYPVARLWYDECKVEEIEDD